MVPKVICKVCNVIFYAKPSHIKLGWGKYCSVTCRNISQFNGNKLRCDICQKEIYRSMARLSHSKSGKFYCSKKCQTLWRNSFFIEERHPNWTDGISIYQKLLKGAVVPKCLLCGLKDERILAVHHKDHNTHNNTLINLVWLCYNCHRLVHIDSKIDENVRNMATVA